MNRATGQALRYNEDMRRSILVFSAYLFLVVSAVAQTQPSLPTLTAFDCPKYPSKAQSMRLQGTVRMEITTDGHQVTNIKVLPSHPVLSEEAVKNVKTWKFADHAPTSFLVTYNYSNEGHWKKDPVTNCAAKMDLPTKVDVSTRF